RRSDPRADGGAAIAPGPGHQSGRPDGAAVLTRLARALCRGGNCTAPAALHADARAGRRTQAVGGRGRLRSSREPEEKARAAVSGARALPLEIGSIGARLRRAGIAAAPLE